MKRKKKRKKMKLVLFVLVAFGCWFHWFSKTEVNAAELVPQKSVKELNQIIWSRLKQRARRNRTWRRRRRRRRRRCWRKWRRGILSPECKKLQFGIEDFKPERDKAEETTTPKTKIVEYNDNDQIIDVRIKDGRKRIDGTFDKDQKWVIRSPNRT